LKTVLVVDDAAFMRISIRKMLEKNGYEVIGEAENGAVAVEKYFELKPYIVTKDKNANILMVSAMGQEAMVKDAVLSGAKGFIVKPFKEDSLIKALSKM
jgi:two-component system chemotaxis response regulator CheY